MADRVPNDRPDDRPGDRPDDALDDVLRRVQAVLAPLPPVAPQAIARVLAAVHAPGRRPAGWAARLRAWGRRVTTPRRVLVASGLAAVLVVALVARPNDSSPSAVAPDVSMRAAGAPATGAGDEIAVPVQFLLDGATLRDAQTVSVAGDFNEWRADAAPMSRLPGTSLWTVSLPVKPGRHTYAFVVNGDRWMADPRAPSAPDTDFGRPGSVLIVGAP